MKTALFGILLAACFGTCQAAGSEVSESYTSTVTVNVVSVSSSTGTQMDPASIVNHYRTVIVLQNLDNYPVYCSEKASVTVATGFRIDSNGGTISLPLRAGGPNGRLTLYCIASKTTGSSSVAVIQAN